MLPIDFFDLSTFEHASLFEENAPAWMALKRIKVMLSTMQLGLIEGVIEEGALLVNPELISIGAGSVVEAGAYIRGPCSIGRKCEVRHGAYIRGNVITGNGCVIGHATEMKNSILLNNACAAHFAYVGDTILGNRVNLGAGVKCANFRFDGKPIRVDGKESGLRKLGAIIGDDTHIGCNAVTMPGTLIGKRSRCYPCLNIGGVIAEDSTIKPSESHALQTENR